MISTYFIIIPIVFSLIGGGFYIKDTLSGKTKPNRVSFLVWAVAPIIGVIISIKNGGGYENVPVFMAGFMPLLILIASFYNKNAYWKLGLIDYVCGFFAITSLFIWIFLKNPVLAFVFAVLTDLIAYIPTLIKSYTNPETETGITYILSTISNIIGLLVIQTWVFTSYGFNLYIIVANLLCIFFLYRKKFL
jgi:hypothetical protein